MARKSRIAEASYTRELKDIRDEIKYVADKIEGVSFTQIADWSGGLGTQTVANFLNGVTRFPEARTLILMAHAVQCGISLRRRVLRAAKGRAS